MTNWLVLGLGNALSGADAFGPAVVARLRDAALPASVTLEDAHTDLLAWVDRFGQYSDVVLVDAAVGPDGTSRCAEANDGARRRGLRSGADATVGATLTEHGPESTDRVSAVDEATFSRWDVRSPGAHELSPIAAVKLFRALERGVGPSPAFHLVALFVDEQEFATPPSPDAIDAGADAVRRLLRSGR